MKHLGATAVCACIATGLLASSTSWAGEIRIGATMRMISENGQKYGQMVSDELDLINAAGGINGHTVKLSLLNDECKSDKGVANVNKFVHQEKVHLVIGSTCSSVSLPIVDVTAKAEVPQIIPHSTNHEITQKGSAWVFRVPISAASTSRRRREVRGGEHRHEGRLCLRERCRRGIRRGGHAGFHARQVQRRAGVLGTGAGKGDRLPRTHGQDQGVEA